MSKIGRNKPCPCGSNKKYKKCCLLKIKPKRKPNSTRQRKKLLPELLTILSTGGMLFEYRKG